MMMPNVAATDTPANSHPDEVGIDNSRVQHEGIENSSRIGAIEAPIRKSSSTSTDASNKMGLASKLTMSSNEPSSYTNTSIVKPLEAALAFWTHLDLRGTCRSELERQGRELKEAKESTIKNRKRLAEATKEWRKSSSSGKGAEDLLKAYQEEIDNLTRRARGADAAFANVYQALYDAPDPTPYLSTALSDRRVTASLEVELGRLQREIQEYEIEFRKLKNQDVTIRRLQEKLMAYEKEAAGDMAASVEEARAEIEALADARVREAVEREQRLEARLVVAQEAQAVAEEGRARAQAQVFEVARQAEERAAAMGSEGELLAQERERHKAEADALRKELEAAVAAVAAAKRGDALLSMDGHISPASVSFSLSAPVEGSSSSSSSKILALQNELDEMGASLALVRHRFFTKEEEWTQAQARMQETAEGLERELDKERKARAEVEEGMCRRPAMEEVVRLRRQIRMLQQLEFNGAEEEEGGEEAEGGEKGRARMNERQHPLPLKRVDKCGQNCELVEEEENEEEEGEGGVGEASVRPSVGHLLMSRLRRMETEVMASRRKVADMEGERKRLEEMKCVAEAKAQAQSVLVARLENDLARVVAKGRMGGGGGEGDGGGEGEEAICPAANLVGALSPFSHLLQTEQQQQQQQQPIQERGEALTVDMHELLTTAAKVAPSSFSSSSSISASTSSSIDLVQILQDQRDRYKCRVRTLEGELAAAGHEIGRFKVQAETMLRDNLTLYEKMRFLQCYGRGRSSGGRRGKQVLATASTGPTPLHQRQQGSGSPEGMMEAGDVLTTAAATEVRYRRMYEEQLNPFAAFSAAERFRNYQDMNVVDKITLQGARAFLANKTARMMVFMYFISLHVLVFLTLYMWGHHHCADLYYPKDSPMSIPSDAQSFQGNHGVEREGGIR